MHWRESNKSNGAHYVDSAITDRDEWKASRWWVY